MKAGATKWNTELVENRAVLTQGTNSVDTCELISLNYI